MIVDEVKVGLKRTIRTGEFESLSVEVGFTVTLSAEDNVDLHGTMAGLWAMAGNNVKAQTQPFRKRDAAALEEIALGLPPELAGQLQAHIARLKAEGGE